MVWFREMEVVEGREDLRVRYFDFSCDYATFEIPLRYSSADVM